MLLLSHDLYYSLKVEKPLHRFWTLLAHTLSPGTHTTNFAFDWISWNGQGRA